MRTLTIFSLLMLLASAQMPPALAQEPAAAASDPCIGVEVNGQRSQSYSCLTQKLQPTPSPQAANPDGKIAASEEIAHRPSNQIGLFNYSATSHRMGNQFGISVFPQRPTPAPPPTTFPHINH